MAATSTSGPLARARARAAERPALWAFLRLFAMSAFVFLAIGAVLPALPPYVKEELGAGDVAVGIVIGAFAVSGVVTRPLAGRLADARGRRLVATGGALAAAAAGAMYFIPAGVPGLVLARLVLGIADGAVFVAGITWVVDLAPVARRGQWIGWFGLSIWASFSLGPLIGEGLLRIGGYGWVWAFAAASPLVSAAISRTLGPGLPSSAPSRGGALLPREALRPGAALGLAQLGFVAMAGFSVLLLRHQGVDGGAAIFTAFAAAVVGARLVFGRLPDRLGPQRTAIAAGAGEAAGLALIGFAHGLPVAIAGALVMGTGFSILYPSLALMVVDRVSEDRHGAALGTFTAFVDVGVGIGGPLIGAAAALGGYPWAFWAAAAGSALAALVVLPGAQRASARRAARVDAGLPPPG